LFISENVRNLVASKKKQAKIEVEIPSTLNKF